MTASKGTAQLGLLGGRRRARRGLTLVELLAVLLILAAVSGLMLPLFSELGVTVFRDGEKKSPQEIATERSMQVLREAILGTPGQPGYFTDMGDLPRADFATQSSTGRPGTPQLRYLFINPAIDGLPIGQTAVTEYDPVTRTGWRGPYVQPTGVYRLDADAGFTTDYGDIVPPYGGTTADPAVIDAWGNPIVLQEPTGVIEISSQRGDQYARLVSAGPNGVLETPVSSNPTTWMPIPELSGDDLLLFLFVEDQHAGER